MSKLDQIEKLRAKRDSNSGGEESSFEQRNYSDIPLFPVRLVALVSISTIAMLKASLVVLGIVDLIVGIYGLLVISLFFAAFFLAYTKYKDPSKIQVDANDHTRNYPNSENNSNTILLPPNPQASQYQPAVSVIIPIYNEQDLIKETVESCLNAAYPPEKIEVILVNDGSTDNTAAFLDSLRRAHSGRVKIVHLLKNVGKRKAIREGILQGQADGEIIVLVDSDSVMDQFAIQKLVDAFSSDPDIGAATGHGRVKNARQNTLTRIQETWYDGQFSVMKGMESSLDTVSCCSGILSAYRKEAILPCLDRWSNDTFLGSEFSPGDDRHLTSYLLGGSHHYIGKSNRVWKAKYVASAITFTEVPSTLRQLVKQQTRWKKSWVRMFCFNLPFYFSYRPASAAYIYYLQTALSFISPIVAFRSLVWLPLEGDFTTAMVYLSGIFFVGTLFAVEYKLRHPDSGKLWLYRFLLPMLSITVLNNLIFYALLTIKKRSWLTR